MGTGSNFCLDAHNRHTQGLHLHLWTDDTYDGFAYSQCKTSNTQYPGDRTDNPIFGGGGFDMRGTAGACKTKCDDPNTKDSHGRQCVAFEHSSQDPHAVAHCAFAWDCSEIGHWGGGKVYRRRSLHEPHMQRWNVGHIPCLSWDAQLGVKSCRCHANGDNNYTCDQRRLLEEDAEEEKVEDALDQEEETENNATFNKKKESTGRRKQ